MEARNPWIDRIDGSKDDLRAMQCRKTKWTNDVESKAIRSKAFGFVVGKIGTDEQSGQVIKVWGKIRRCSTMRRRNALSHAMRDFVSHLAKNCFAWLNWRRIFPSWNCSWMAPKGRRYTLKNVEHGRHHRSYGLDSDVAHKCLVSLPCRRRPCKVGSRSCHSQYIFEKRNWLIAACGWWSPGKPTLVQYV